MAAKDLTLIQSLVYKRALPGLLILDMQGNVLFSNSIIQPLLKPESEILKRVRTRLLKMSKKRRLSAKYPSTEGAAALIEFVIFKSKRRWYGLRAFMLSQPHQLASLVAAVLVERINPQRSVRLNLLEARQSFKLTPRETQVIEALQLGMTDKQIAFALGVSTETVRGYLKIIRAKLGVSTRTAILYKLLSL